MGDFLKLLAFGATAAAAVVVAKEVIERTEKGEDCSPMAVIKGIGKKIGDFCADEANTDDDDLDWDDLEDFEDFEITEEAGVDFDTDYDEGEHLGDETEPVDAQAAEEAEVPAEDKAAEESEDAAEAEAPEYTVDDALKSVAESFDADEEA